MSDKHKITGTLRWALIFVLATLLTAVALPAFGAEGAPVEPAESIAKTGKTAQDLPGVLAGLLIIGGMGFALGCFGLVVNHIFHKRSLVAYIFMTRKPGLSLLTGIIITLVVLGLLAILGSVPKVQGVILLVALLGLGILTIGCVSRLAAQIVEPGIIEDELPGTWAHIKGGLVLMSINIVVLVGNIFFLGVLLTGAGATLLSYFAGAVSMPVEPGRKPASSGKDEPPP